MPHYMLKTKQDTYPQEHVTMLNRRAIGAFPNYETIESALRELNNSGFSMNQVSVVGHDVHQHPDLAAVHTSERMTNADSNHRDADQTKAEEGVRAGTVAGGAVGGLTGLLVGLGAVAIPGIGPVMLAGAAATAIASAISGSVIGGAAGSLVGGLMGLNIPANQAKGYSDRVDRGEYLVVVEGSEADITQAGSTLAKHHVSDWYTYDLPVAAMPMK
jgi:hypothetical protein